jgi:hypothetical protein
MLRIGDQALEELIAVEDAEELCRRLLAAPWAWGRSTRHQEAIELLATVHGTTQLRLSSVALTVCTCGRWDRVTARLITALEQSGLLEDAELDELAESFLSHERVISFQLVSGSPEWLEVALDDSHGPTVTVTEETIAQHCLRVEPPLRRWAAHRALRAHPARHGQLLSDSDLLAPRDGDALIHGMLDAADVLEEPERRGLVGRGLHGGQSNVRLAALEVLCELDGPDAARRRADADTNATVRQWKPPRQLTNPTLL